MILNLQILSTQRKNNGGLPMLPTCAASFSCLLVLPALAANLFMLLTYAANFEMLPFTGFEPGTAAL
jgi:hypothetical protein